MTEASERNSPDGAVSRGYLLPVVYSNRVSLRKPTLILTLQSITENSFRTERIHYFSCSSRQGLRRQLNWPSLHQNWHVEYGSCSCLTYPFVSDTLLQILRNVNVGTDTAVRETRCTTKVVTLIVQSVIRGRGVARTQVANGGAGHFHTKSVIPVLAQVESRTLDFRESKCLFRGPEILMRTKNYKQSQ